MEPTETDATTTGRGTPFELGPMTDGRLIALWDACGHRGPGVIPVRTARDLLRHIDAQAAALAVRDAENLRLSKDFEEMAACWDEPMSRASREADGTWLAYRIGVLEAARGQGDGAIEELTARVGALETGLTGHLQRAAIHGEPVVIAPQQIGGSFGDAYAWMRAGWRVRRAQWNPGAWLVWNDGCVRAQLRTGATTRWCADIENMSATDWQIIEGEKP